MNFMSYLRRLQDQLVINVLGYYYSFQLERTGQENLVTLEPKSRHPYKIKVK